MASAFSKLFLPGHRKRNSLSAKRDEDPQRTPLQPQQPASSGRKSFASARPSFQASILEEAPLQLALPGIHRSAFLTTDSLNAPPPVSADHLAYASRTSLDLDPSSRSTIPNFGGALAPEESAAPAAASAPHRLHDNDDDDNDLDANAVFLRLSEDATMRQDWDAARLVLVPLRRCLPLDALSELACLEDDAYIALHALAPSRLFKDQFVSVRSLADSIAARASSEAQQTAPVLARTQAQAQAQVPPSEQRRAEPQSSRPWNELSVTATLLPDQRAVNVSITRSSSAATKGQQFGHGRPQSIADSERKLRIVAETTVYRTISVPQAALSQPPSEQFPSNRSSASSSFEVLSRSSPARALPKQEKIKVRVISVEGVLVPPALVSDHTLGRVLPHAPSSRPVTASSAGAVSAGGYRTLLQPGSTTASRNVSPSGSIAFPSVEQEAEQPLPPEGIDMSRHISSSSHRSVAQSGQGTINTVTIAAEHSGAPGARLVPTSSPGNLSETVLSHIPASRSFVDDLRLLLSPPVELAALATPFGSASDVLASSALEFTSAFVFVKGFEQYNVNRIRRGIFQKAWRTLLDGISTVRGGRDGDFLPTTTTTTAANVELSSEAMQRLQELVENVVLGYVHEKLYGSIADQWAEADRTFEELLALYDSCAVGLVELDVYVPTLRHRPGRLEAAVSTLRAGLLAYRPVELDDALASCDRSELLDALRKPQRSGGADGYSTIDSDGGNDGGLAHAMAASLDLTSDRHHTQTERQPRAPPIKVRTPRETMQALKATIDEIGLAVQRSHLASSRTSLAATMEQPPLLSTDDLLPILAYVIIKAQPAKLASCIYYAKAFQLIEPGQSDLSWALVTFEAVVEYLKGDPLGIRRSSGSTSTNVDAFGFRLGGTASRHGSIGDASMRSLPSRHKAASGSIAAGSHYHTVSMSRQDSDQRDRRGSMPLGSSDGTWSPTSPMSPSSSGGAPFPGSHGLGYFPPRADPPVQLSEAAMEDSSPLLKQEDFKMPGLPASSSVSTRPSSRGWHRPRSFYSNAEGSGSRNGLSDSPRMGPQAPSQPPSRQSNTRSRTISLNAGGGGNELQIRPQIVRSGRHPSAASVSQIDLSTIAGASPSMERSGSSASGGRSVRVVGSSSLSTASPPMASRRKSIESWTALSFFSGGGGGGGQSSSSDGRASLDVHGDDQSMFRRFGGLPTTRPHSFAESAASSDGNGTGNDNGNGSGFQGNASSSSISWLPWGTDGARRPNTPGTSSVASAEGILSSASTYSSMTRSASTSGFASIHASGGTHANESSPPVGDGVAFVSASASVRRAPSIRSNSSYSSAPGPDERPGACANASASIAAQLQAAQSTSQLRVPPARKRYRARFLSNAGSSTFAAPLPATVTREATAGDMDHRASEKRSMGSLSAARASDACASLPPSHETPSSSSGTVVEMAGSNGDIDDRLSGSAASLGSGLARRGELLPPFFRLLVPSPVKEIVDPLAIPSPTVTSATPSDARSPHPDGPGPTSSFSSPLSSPLLPIGCETLSQTPRAFHTPLEFDLGIFADLSSPLNVNLGSNSLDASQPNLSNLVASHSTFKRRAARPVASTPASSARE